MNVQLLIGKLALRTKPVTYGTGAKDHSFTHEPIKILTVTENHIVFEYPEDDILAGRKKILDERWIDDNWTDYDGLLALANDEVVKQVSEMIDTMIEIAGCALSRRVFGGYVFGSAFKNE